MIHHFQVSRTNWGISVKVDAEPVSMPPEGFDLFEVTRGVCVVPNFPITQDDHVEVCRGLKMVAKHLPRPVLIQVNSLLWGARRYQKDAIPFAIAAWAAERFRFDEPRFRVTYNKSLDRYVFEEHKKMIKLTQRAADAIKEVAAQQEGKLYLRVRVVGGGCSGFSTKLDLTDEVSKDDVQDEQHGVGIAVDGRSILYVGGAVVDYVEDAKGFTIDNPTTSPGCACGSAE